MTLQYSAPVCHTHTETNDAHEPVRGSSQTCVIFVGIGGATCAGKTTLANHLQKILPDSFIIHQDDFVATHSEDALRINPALRYDMENAPTAIMWSRLRTFLRTVKHLARIPDDHVSSGHLNEVRPVPLSDMVAARCQAEIMAAQSDFEAATGVHIFWGLVEGYLLYWDQEIVDILDAKVFLRWPHDVLEERRSQREYISAEGVPWKDPPGYFEHVAYPAYIDAHRNMFTNGDVEGGSPLLPGLVLIEPLQMSMDDVFARCCREVVSVLRRPLVTEIDERRL